MFKLLALLLGFCQLSFGAEINIHELRKALKDEFEGSARADRDIALHAEQFGNNNDFTQTALILPKNFKIFNNDFNMIANQIGKVIIVLKKYQNTKLKGDVYVPNSIFNNIEDGFSSLVNIFHSIVNHLQEYVNAIVNNEQDFKLNSNGDFVLPPGVGPRILYYKNILHDETVNLQNGCFSIQSAMKAASELLNKAVKHRGAKFFAKTANAFEKGAVDFGRIAGDIGNMIDEFESLGMNHNGHVVISAKKLLKFFNNGLSILGHAYSEKAQHVSSQAKHYGSSSSSSFS